MNVLNTLSTAKFLGGLFSFSVILFWTENVAILNNNDANPLDKLQKLRGDLQGPLLTLFTTFKNVKARENIHWNTILNWASLGLQVKPVLYITEKLEKNISDYAILHGWSIHQAPNTNTEGLPTLKHMFLDARKVSPKTPFYGYANDDLLFTRDLVHSLKAIHKHASKFKQMLIVGRRINQDLGANNSQIHTVEEVEEYARGGHLYDPYAQDYFITTVEGYPWDSIPNFVVGRAGFDNWLLVSSIFKDIPVIDASKTITALHQSVKAESLKSHLAVKDGDAFVNYKMAGRNFRYVLGNTACAHIELFHRRPREKDYLTSTGLDLRHRKHNICRLYYFRFRKNPNIHSQRIQLNDGQ